MLSGLSVWLLVTDPGVGVRSNIVNNRNKAYSDPNLPTESHFLHQVCLSLYVRVIEQLSTCPGGKGGSSLGVSGTAVYRMTVGPVSSTFQ